VGHGPIIDVIVKVYEHILGFQRGVGDTWYLGFIWDSGQPGCIQSSTVLVVLILLNRDRRDEFNDSIIKLICANESRSVGYINNHVRSENSVKA